MLSQQPADIGGKEPVVTPRRPFWSRMSVGQIVMIVAGLAAFVLNVNVIRAQEATTLVAVANGDLMPGVPFESSMVDLVAIDAENPVVDRLITEDSLGSYDGMIVTSRVLGGEFVAAADLAEEAADENLRAFTVRVDASHAGGGTLIGRGDRIDLIAVDDGVARYVVTAAQVLQVPARESGGIVGVNDYYIVIAVDADTALAVSEALQADSVEVVLATGAPEPERMTLGPEDEGPTGESGAEGSDTQDVAGAESGGGG